MSAPASDTDKQQEKQNASAAAALLEAKNSDDGGNKVQQIEQEKQQKSDAKASPIVSTKIDEDNLASWHHSLLKLSAALNKP